MDVIPVIDITPWFDGGPPGRAQVAAAVDEALRGSGFMLVSGHGVPLGVRAATRRAAKRFFALPTEVKAAYTTSLDGQGWLPQGEVQSRLEGQETAADLKESYLFLPQTPTGDPAVDEVWFRPNVYPAEVPELEPAVREHVRHLTALSHTLMSICAVALGRSPNFFEPYLTHPTNNFRLTWYPPLTRVRPGSANQYRGGPHTDSGTITILDRQPGLGGLQVYVRGEWENVPFDPEALTINVGELLARWTGDRWRATRHQVLPPSPAAPHEELLSMIMFCAVDLEAVVSPLDPEVGPVDYPAVTWGDFFTRRAASLEVPAADRRRR